MLIELSFDDGDMLDKEVIRLLDKYGITATFYVPVMSWGYSNLDIYNHHLMGNHTINHPSDLKLLSDHDLKNEILSPHKFYKDNCRNYSFSFCPPRGRYDNRVIDICAKLQVDIRTTIVGNTCLSDNIIQHTSVHVYPNRVEYKGKHWLDYAMDLYENCDDCSYFHIWGHSWEIEKFGLWGELETLLKFIKKDYEDLCGVGE